MSLNYILLCNSLALSGIESIFDMEVPLCDMTGFQQPIRIGQQLCSIAQFNGTKFPHEFKEGEIAMMPEKFFGLVKAG